MSDIEENQPKPKDAPAPSDPGRSLAQAIGARNLMIVILVMPVIFLIAVMTVIAIFGRPGEGRARAATEARPIVDAAATGAIVLPAGAKIAAMALDGDRLALRVEEDAGEEIVIYDLTRGAVIQRVRVEAGPAAPAP